jgi:hypothetical protein
MPRWIASAKRRAGNDHVVGASHRFTLWEASRPSEQHNGIAMMSEALRVTLRAARSAFCRAGATYEEAL